MKIRITITFFMIIILGVISCSKNELKTIEPDRPVTYVPTPYTINVPKGFPKMPIPKDNPLTVEGIALGRKLFYDPILSKNNKQSCASCHNQEFGFTDNGKQFSEGVDGKEGDRNAMAIFNLGWNINFFWDGRSPQLEDQALGPVPNPIEMHLEWKEAEKKLNVHAEYPKLFKQAFAVDSIDSNSVAKAISQFERTIISANSKWDQKEVGKAQLTSLEKMGEIIFFTEKGDCFHCHGGPLFTFNTFHNNGLVKTHTDIGLAKTTGSSSDRGKFKAPTLRNIELTAPYMHDGRFKTLEEVVDFYDSGVVQSSENIDPQMKKSNRGVNGKLGLKPDEKKALVAFLKTLTDEEFKTNKAFSDPNK